MIYTTCLSSAYMENGLWVFGLFNFRSNNACQKPTKPHYDTPDSRGELSSHFLTNKGKIMLNKEQKEKWLEALKSGKYKQGKVQFYNSVKDEYCCLGVLCKTLGVPTMIMSTGNWKAVDPLIPRQLKWDLVDENDNSRYKGVMDFSTVIPLIEKLPTE